MIYRLRGFILVCHVTKAAEVWSSLGCCGVARVRQVQPIWNLGGATLRSRDEKLNNISRADYLNWKMGALNILISQHQALQM